MSFKSFVLLCFSHYASLWNQFTSSLDTLIRTNYLLEKFGVNPLPLSLFGSSIPPFSWSRTDSSTSSKSQSATLVKKDDQNAAAAPLPWTKGVLS